MESLTREQLSRLIAQIVPNIIQGVHMGFLADRTLTHSQFFVLIAIHSRSRRTMHQLAQKMHVSMPTMSGIIERLVQAKFVERVDNPEDRREVLIELTKEGRMLIAKFQEAVSGRWQKALSALSADEVKTMGGLLGKIRASLQKEGKSGDA